jgi:hypothetical protein
MPAPSTNFVPARDATCASCIGAAVSVPLSSSMTQSLQSQPQPEPNHQSMSIWAPLEREVCAVDAPPPQGYESVIDALRDALRRRHEQRPLKPASNASATLDAVTRRAASAAAVANVPSYRSVRPTHAERRSRCLNHFLKCCNLFKRFEAAVAADTVGHQEHAHSCSCGLLSQILENVARQLAGKEWVGQLAGAAHLRRAMTIRPPPITQALEMEGLAESVLELLVRSSPSSSSSSSSSSSEPQLSTAEVLLLRELARALSCFIYFATPEQQEILQQLDVGPALVRCLGRATTDEELAARLLQCLCNLPTDTLVAAAPLPVLLRHVNANHARCDRNADGGGATNAAKAQSRKLNVQRRLCMLFRTIMENSRVALAELQERHRILPSSSSFCPASSSPAASAAPVATPIAVDISVLQALATFLLHSSDDLVLEHACGAWACFLENGPRGSDDKAAYMQAIYQAAADAAAAAATPAVADGTNEILPRLVQLAGLALFDVGCDNTEGEEETDASSLEDDGEEMEPIMEVRCSKVAEAALSTLSHVVVVGSHAEDEQLFDLGLLPILLRHLGRAASIRP